MDNERGLVVHEHGFDPLEKLWCNERCGYFPGGGGWGGGGSGCAGSRSRRNARGVLVVPNVGIDIDGCPASWCNWHVVNGVEQRDGVADCNHGFY